MKNSLLILQNYLLLCGTLFAGYNWVNLLNRYIRFDGSFLVARADNGLINPFLTPCFYGFLVFLLGFIWSYTLRLDYSKASQYRLIWLLAVGAMFAWGNYVYEVVRYYNNQVCNLGCTAGYFGIPLFTSCVVGATLFTLTLITALVLRRKAD